MELFAMAHQAKASRRTDVIYFFLVKNAEISCLCLKNELSLCRN